MVSNIIGQGKSEEVLPLIRRIAKVSLLCASTIFILLNLWPRLFLAFYGQGDALIHDAIPVLRIVSVALLLMAVGAIWLNAVTGTGNTKVNLVIESITITL